MITNSFAQIKYRLYKLCSGRKGGKKTIQYFRTSLRRTCTSNPLFTELWVSSFKRVGKTIPFGLCSTDISPVGFSPVDWLRNRPSKTPLAWSSLYVPEAFISPYQKRSVCRLNLLPFFKTFTFKYKSKSTIPCPWQLFDQLLVSTADGVSPKFLWYSLKFHKYICNN